MQKVQTSLRIDEIKLKQAKIILSELGLNFTDAVNIFTNMIVLKKGLPFDVSLPNTETMQAMNDIRMNKETKTVSISALKTEINFDEKSK